MAEPDRNVPITIVLLAGGAALIAWQVYSGNAPSRVSLSDILIVEFDQRAPPPDPRPQPGPVPQVWVAGSPVGSWSGTLTGKSGEWTYRTMLHLEPDGSFNWFFQDAVMFAHGWGTYSWGLTSSANAWIEMSFRGCAPPERIPPEKCRDFSRTHLLTALDRDTIQFGTIRAVMRRSPR